MKTYTFKGGIHPPEKKELTQNCAIEKIIPFTKTVIIPVTQGGAPNKPLVKVGDIVARGQKIAESDSFVSAPVHASLAGTVKKIETRVVTGNIEAPCIIIEGDGSDKMDFMPILDPFTCTADEALKRVRNAGITGMGGASFPTYVKLSPAAGKKIDYVIANGAECEPYLTIDERMMFEMPEKIVDGVAIEMRIVNAPEGIIAVEDNKMHVVPKLEEAIQKSAHKNIKVAVVKTKYPQGGEKMLTKAVVNREVPSGGFPTDIGCVIQNIGTLCAVSEAFREGKPLIDRALTVSGASCQTPKNILVPIGTLIGDLIPTNIILHPGTVKIIAGGPMMGFSMQNAHFPVQKNTSGVLFLTKNEASLTEEGICIGCGRCLTACGCRLVPVMMVRSLKANDLEAATKYGLMDCVECGGCAYVCPGRIKLVQRFKIGKQLVREEAAKKAALQKGDK